jgi:uncharacterized protein involved in type VI secretion and phage assembly
MMDVSLDWLSAPPDDEDEVEKKPKRFYGVTTGRVINMIDPMQLGRVQLQLPFIDDLDLSPWARVATPMSGVLSGVSMLPQIGDEVLVAFEHGDVNVPYVVGSLWNGLAPPPPNLPVPDSPVRTSYMIRTLTGNQILIVEEPPTIQILAPTAGQSLTMTNAGTAVVSATSVSITVAGSTVVISPAGVQIAGETVTIAATTALNMTAPTINMTASGLCTVVGTPISLNP